LEGDSALRDIEMDFTPGSDLGGHLARVKLGKGIADSIDLLAKTRTK
jgi:hypothetical protein